MDVSQVQAYADILNTARAGTTAGAVSEQPQGVEQSFGNLLLSALNNVNDSQVKGMELEQQFITNPDSVDVHDVTIALAEANLAISMTKAIVDRALAAYREIINMR